MIQIRQEQPSDYPAIQKLIQEAFETIEYSDHQEHLLVERLRKSTAYIPELALVATIDEQIVGYILLTKLAIENKNVIIEEQVLALAPVAVSPTFQGQGIGGKLILEAHEIARKLTYKAIILLGHQDYYPRFGYRQTAAYNITLPFEAPEENCMLYELYSNSLKNITGIVKYPRVFFE